MKSTILIPLALAAFAHLTLATPDCYDFSVTTAQDSFFEMLPKMLYYGNVDWMKLQAGKNCGFYTYGDVFIKSYDASTSAIYFVFKKTLGTTCELDTTLKTFNNQTWLYANSLNADSDVCGYYVGIANSGVTDQMVQIVRSSAHFVKLGLIALISTSMALLY